MLDSQRPHRRPTTAVAALAAALALLMLGASAANADVIRRTSGAAITVNDASGQTPGTATPYPATLYVNGQPNDRGVVGVRVKLNDVTHGYPGDLDIALQGPNGARVVLMSDVGGGHDLDAVDLTFDDEAPGSAPIFDPIAPGTYRPSDDDLGGEDTFPAGAPVGGYTGRLDEFSGSNPNGAWRLFVVDDAGNDAGTIGGWQITIETGPIGRHNSAVTIADDGTAPTAASPYGAPIELSGVSGRVAEATVTLEGLRHADPGDLDVMLEAPQGQVATLMSDAGGVHDISGRKLRFDDDAPATLSDTNKIESGTYKPTNNQGADAFPAPAPAQPDPAVDPGLSTFDGLDANGTWKLWVVDDAAGSSGAIDGGWTLELELEPYVQLAPGTVEVGEAAGTQTVTVKRPEGGAAGSVEYSLNTLDHEYDAAPASGKLSFDTGQKTKTFTATVLDDTADEPTEQLPLSLYSAAGDLVLDNMGGTSGGLLAIEDDEAPAVDDDFNGDGYADLATGVPGEDFGGDADAGLVTVVYGIATGLTPNGSHRFTQDTAGVADTTEPGDRFGAAIASGDFNADGFADLAVGVPGEEVSNPADGGAVAILYGSASGLTSAGNTLLHQDSANVPGTSEAGDRFGEALAAGNFGRTAHTDLAVGHPGEDVGAANGAGTVTALYGAASGLSGASAETFSQAVSGFPDTAETGDALGASLATGDLGRGAESDLAIGAPGENAGAGAAHVLHGAPAGGLGLTAAQQWSQTSAGVLDGAAAGDGFATTLAISGGYGSDPGKLAIGAPGEDIGAASDAGAVHVLRSVEKDGVDAAGNQLWAQSTQAVLDSPESGDRFGAALAWGTFGTQVADKGDSKVVGASPEDLAIGVPGETLSGVQSGAMAVLYGDTGAKAGAFLTDDSNQLWHQNSSGVLDSNHAGDQFGAALAGFRRGLGKAHDAVAIGVPGEAAGAGTIAVLEGPTAGLYTSAGNARFKQGTAGIFDAAEAGDGFGGVLAP